MNWIQKLSQLNVISKIVWFVDYLIIAVIRLRIKQFQTNIKILHVWLRQASKWTILNVCLSLGLRQNQVDPPTHPQKFYENIIDIAV